MRMNRGKLARQIVRQGPPVLSEQCPIGPKSTRALPLRNGNVFEASIIKDRAESASSAAIHAHAQEQRFASTPVHFVATAPHFALCRCRRKSTAR